MRIYLLPITTRRTLLFAQRLNVVTTDHVSLLDRLVVRASRMWAGWERRESGWQRRVVDGGNSLLRRIPYQEWGLKSVPPLSARLHAEELRARAQGRGRVEVVFPVGVVGRGLGVKAAAARLVAGQKDWDGEEERGGSSGGSGQAIGDGGQAIGEATQLVTESLRSLATERTGYHRRMLLWSFVGMPITAPFAIVPIIPNLPFFYLVYRAWSHWRALAGGKHVQFLLDNDLLAMRPSTVLDQIYKPERLPSSKPKPTPAAGDLKGTGGTISDAGPATAAAEDDETEQVIMSRERGRAVAAALDLPQLEVELERAVWQVERKLRKKKEQEQEQEQEQTQKQEQTQEAETEMAERRRTEEDKWGKR